MRFIDRLLSHASSQLDVSQQLIDCNELYQVPDTAVRIRVKSGRGWMTIDGQDIVLTDNQQLTIDPHKTAVLISPLGKKPLLLEQWDRHHSKLIGDFRLSLNPR